MHVLLGVGIVALFVLLVVLRDYSMHLWPYRRVKNRAARRRGEPEPYPNGRLRPDARRAQLAYLRQHRTVLLGAFATIAVLNLAMFAFAGHESSTDHTRWIGGAVVAAVAFAAVAFTTTRTSNQ